MIEKITNMHLFAKSKLTNPRIRTRILRDHMAFITMEIFTYN